MNFGLYMHACADNCIVYESKIQQKNLPKLSLKKKSKGKARNTGRFTTVQESMVISSGCLTPDRDGCKLQARACVMQSERQTKT